MPTSVGADQLVVSNSDVFARTSSPSGDTLASASPYRMGIDVKVVEVLDRAVEEIDRSFSDHPADRAAVLHTLGSTFRAIGEPARAETPLAQSLELRRSILGTRDPDTLTTARELGETFAELGRYDESETLLLGGEQIC